MVGEEERRQMEELKLARKLSQQEHQQTSSSGGANQTTLGANSQCKKQARVASNLNVHRRNMWIKCALIEKKLVTIVEHLAANGSKYYEADALMANPLTAQLLCSLLVGACALEFSCSKTADYYQFEEPSADELLKRHKLSNPIACLCSTPGLLSATNSPPPAARLATSCRHHRNIFHQAGGAKLVGRCQSASLNQHSKQPQTLARSETDGNNAGARKKRNRRATISQTSSRSDCSPAEAKKSGQRKSSLSNVSDPGELADNADRANRPASPSSLVRTESRRRPLALKTNIRTGALVTDCHHSCCQDISERQHTRGYSFKSVNSTNGLANAGPHQTPNGHLGPQQANFNGSLLAGGASQLGAGCQQQRQQDANWPIWSPRMLHETLHQNSKSNLLYAKNNVLLETQAHGNMAGYLSLHQTSNDLILKWIPNQLINGGHQTQQQVNGIQLNSTKQKSCSSGGPDEAKKGPDEPLCVYNSSCQRAQSLDNETIRLNDSNGQRHGPNIETNCDHVRRLSSNMTNLFEQQNELTRTQAAVGGSYLDLVVSLSVTRIVLLHSHFGVAIHKFEEFEPDSAPDSEQKQAETALEPIPRAPIQHLNPASAAEQETLILVEADGIQRAPFKFPKGGLRWFLSCLETGLAAIDKYLEPAIKLDGSNHAFASDQLGPTIPDPLQLANGMLAVMDSPSALSESSGATSRFDSILRRLSSLRRRSAENKKNKSADTSIATTTANSSQANSRVASPTSASERTISFNCVYRIVSRNQPELQTPPHSAVSVASSSSGSFMLTGGKSIYRQVCHQDSGPNSADAAGGVQRFGWSLSRLARFSSRGNSTSSASNTVETQLTIDQQTTTVESSLASPGGSLDLRKEDDQHEVRMMKRDSSTELIRIESKLNSLKKTSSEQLMALKDQSIMSLCEQMRKQILARAFYGWLAYCRRMRIIKNHLVKLVKVDELELIDEQLQVDAETVNGLTWTRWGELRRAASSEKQEELAKKISLLVYYGGIEDNRLRAETWPYLLGHYQLGDTEDMRESKDNACKSAYEAAWREWIKIERVIKRRDGEILAANMARAARKQNLIANGQPNAEGRSVSETSEDLLNLSKQSYSNNVGQLLNGELEVESEDEQLNHENHGECDEFDEKENADLSSMDSKLSQREPINSNETTAKDQLGPNDADIQTNVSATQARSEQSQAGDTNPKFKKRQQKLKDRRRRRGSRRFRLESTGSVGSDASITDQFGNNIHRIDKDVQRCDRNFWYFKETSNLDKLRNIMCSYVWKHLDVGYVQGMCDLAAPFLVIFDDEMKAYNCFSQLMKRMVANFPHGSAMDQHFESLKYLMQVLDPKLFEVLQNNGDYTHFYFCYRWLLLDFKRELAYEDIYRVWETIWSARYVATDHFVVFLALAMVRYYRDIIIENNMDFTDTIKFFNEMAERHDIRKIIALAQDSIFELVSLIES